MVNTKLWSDSWVRKLNALDRYLFLYLLTNEHTNICGVYELPIGTIAYETGIDERDLEKTMIPRLEPKVYYIDEWIYLKNFEKHQQYNESVRVGIQKAKRDIPERILAKIKEIIAKDTDCPQTATPRGVSESESELESNLKEKEYTPSQIAKDFFLKEGKYQEYLDLFSLKSDRRFMEEEFDKFILYWTEPNKSGTKVRWEQQTVFDIKRRLLTWMSNKKQWSEKRFTNKNTPNFVL